MPEMDDTPFVTEADVNALARTAGLLLLPGRAATLARAFEADLRGVRRLRDVAMGEIHPAGPSALAPRASEAGDGRR